MNMAEGKRTMLLLMDFSKAFDKVPFQQMMAQVKRMGIRETAGLWIESWLCFVLYLRFPHML